MKTDSRVVIEVQANIAEYAAMVGVPFEFACRVASKGGYFKMLEAIHKGCAK